MEHIENNQKLSNFDRFWSVYPQKKSKGAARKAFDKAVRGTDEDEMTEEIISAIIAQKKYRKLAESAGEFVPQWKYPGVWLNAEAWSDEIKSHADIKEKINIRECTEPGCSNQTHGARYSACAEHLKDARVSFDVEKRQYLRSNGIVMTPGETIAEYAAKCRKHLKSINPGIAKTLGV